MDILVEISVAERKMRAKRLWSEVSDVYVWMIYLYVVIVILVVASFVLESSVTVDKDGGVRIVFGGPVSWCGLAVALGLCFYAVRNLSRSDRIVGEMVRDDEILFVRFSDRGVEYGLRNVWTKYYSWGFILRIDVTRHSFVFVHPGGRLIVKTENLKHEEVAELIAVFRAQRTLLPPEALSGWRRSNGEKASYGSIRAK